MQIIIDDVQVTFPDSMPQDEMQEYVKQERAQWVQTGKTLGRIELVLDGEEVVVKAFEQSPIRRVRRITGYLSQVENFNDAKKAELMSRTSHISQN